MLLSPELPVDLLHAQATEALFDVQEQSDQGEHDPDWLRFGRGDLRPMGINHQLQDEGLSASGARVEV
jgi:hypothetical protein